MEEEGDAVLCVLHRHHGHQVAYHIQHHLAHLYRDNRYERVMEKVSMRDGARDRSPKIIRDRRTGIQLLSQMLAV